MGANACKNGACCCTDAGDIEDEDVVRPQQQMGHQLNLTEEPTARSVVDGVAPEGLLFIFRTFEGKTKVLTFTGKPVGLYFKEETLPIVVSNVNKGTQAEKLGVQVGWEIRSIGGANLTSCKTYDEAVEIIMKQLATLKEAPAEPVADALIGA
mmetsp:Transcript_150212/g.280164  ORF Transcript_150212/g.280164 Transcript_150212/m.280164 type:complete len:153 (+) Transcript_150212:89-547(+)